MLLGYLLIEKWYKCFHRKFYVSMDVIFFYFLKSIIFIIDLTSRGRIEMKMWMLRVFFSPQMNLKILGQFKKSHTPTKPLIIEACTIPTDVLIIPTIPDSLNLPSKELKIKNCASPFKVYTSKKNPISWTRHMLNHWIWNPDVTIFP